MAAQIKEYSIYFLREGVSFDSFVVSSIPGYFVLTNTKNATNCIFIQNCSLPNYFAKNNVSLWDDIYINWSLCNLNSSFNIPNGQVPSPPNLCALLSGIRVSGPCNITMSGVTDVISSGGPGTSIIDPASTASIKVLKTLVSEDSSVVFVDHGSYIDFHVNGTTPNHPNAYENGTFVNVLDPGINFINLSCTSGIHGVDISQTINNIPINYQTADSVHGNNTISVIGSGDGTANILTSNNLIQIQSDGNIQLNSGIGEYEFLHITSSSGEAYTLNYNSITGLIHRVLSKSLYAMRIFQDVTQVSRSSTANPGLPLHQISLPANTFSLVGQCINLEMRGYVVFNIGGAVNNTFTGVLNGVFGTGATFAQSVTPTLVIPWAAEANLTVLNIVGNIATLEYHYCMMQGSSASILKVVVGPTVDITVINTIGLYAAAGNVAAVITQTSTNVISR